MKKYYTISALAIISLIILYAFYLINMYNDYCYRYTANIDIQVYRAIDKEQLKRASLIYDIDYNKPIKQMRLDKITKEFRDSIKVSPLSTIPRYNINELLEKGIILHSTELFSQCSQDVFFNNGYLLNLIYLDSIFTQSNCSNQHNFILYDSLRNNTSQLNISHPLQYKYVSRKYHIGIEIKQTLLLYYNIPLSDFIKSSIYSLIASIIVVIFIIYLLVLQLSIIRKKYRNLNAIKDNINGTIHDLKSPLSSLAISIDVAKNMVDSEKLQNIFNINLIRINNLIRGIDSILLTSKNGCNVSLAQITYNSLLQSANSIKLDLDILYQKKNHYITIDHKKIENNPNIFVDLYSIESIIRNLLENSLKYSNENVVVKLSIEKLDNFIKITISDNGWGIPKKDIKKVFKPYFMVVDNSLKQGYGIGLSQVSKIVENHNGKIFIESQTGVGTTFTILIPTLDDKC